MFDDHRQNPSHLKISKVREIVALMDKLSSSTQPWSIMNMIPQEDPTCFYVRVYGFGSLLVHARDGEVFRMEVAQIQQRGDLLANEPNF